MRMTKFVTDYAHSETAQWREKLQSSLPTYHVDVVVSVGGAQSSFVTSTSVFERVSNHADPLSKD
jgi:hypothetical protein